MPGIEGAQCPTHHARDRGVSYPPWIEGAQCPTRHARDRGGTVSYPPLSYPPCQGLRGHSVLPAMPGIEGAQCPTRHARDRGAQLPTHHARDRGGTVSYPPCQG
uniref:Uncharacterized protein n=1 Tax=Xenopus tropicalis TaxID=8364 RepID=A0A6I8Q8W3_XENTR